MLHIFYIVFILIDVAFLIYISILLYFYLSGLNTLTQLKKNDKTIHQPLSLEKDVSQATREESPVEQYFDNRMLIRLPFIALIALFTSDIIGLFYVISEGRLRGREELLLRICLGFLYFSSQVSQRCSYWLLSPVLSILHAIACFEKYDNMDRFTVLKVLKTIAGTVISVTIIAVICSAPHQLLDAFRSSFPYVHSILSFFSEIMDVFSSVSNTVSLISCVFIISHVALMKMQSSSREQRKKMLLILMFQVSLWIVTICDIISHIFTMQIVINILPQFLMESSLIFISLRFVLYICYAIFSLFYLIQIRSMREKIETEKAIAIHDQTSFQLDIENDEDFGTIGQDMEENTSDL